MVEEDKIKAVDGDWDRGMVYCKPPGAPKVTRIIEYRRSEGVFQVCEGASELG